jgi:hypothetical protein
MLGLRDVTVFLRQVGIFHAARSNRPDSRRGLAGWQQTERSRRAAGYSGYRRERRTFGEDDFA